MEMIAIGSSGVPAYRIDPDQVHRPRRATPVKATAGAMARLPLQAATIGWSIGQEAMREIERIVRQTIAAPVRPELVAPAEPSLEAPAR
jgi:hypothetical protein